MPKAMFVGRKKATVVVTDARNMNNTASPIMHYTVQFGAPAPDRYIYVVIGGLRNTALDFLTVTIGGVAATQLCAIGENTANSQVVTIWGARVPTGMTGTVIITMNTTTANYMVVYRATGLRNPLTAIVSTGGSATTTQNTAFSPAKGDLVISGVMTTTTAAITWSNIWGTSAGDSQATIAGQSWRYGALAAVFSNGGSYTSTVTASGTVVQGLLVIR